MLTNPISTYLVNHYVIRASLSCLSKHIQKSKKKTTQIIRVFTNHQCIQTKTTQKSQIS